MSDILKFKQLTALAEILADASCSEVIFKCRLNALRTLNGRVAQYRKEDILPSLIETIWDKKWHFIKEATTSNEIAEILKPSLPPYSYGRWLLSSPYHVDEEELVFWAIVSPYNKLIGAAEERYRELFKKCLPEISKELNL